MEKLILFKDWKLKVDFQRTKEVYDSVELGSPEGCECIYCRNFSANRENIYPIEFKDLLQELGINHRKESEIYHIYKKNGKHFYGGFFHFKGEIIESGDSKAALPKEGDSFDTGTVSVNEHFQFGFTKGSSLAFFEKEEFADLIQIDFEAGSDWVLDKDLECE